LLDQEDDAPKNIIASLADLTRCRRHAD